MSSPLSRQEYGLKSLADKTLQQLVLGVRKCSVESSMDYDPRIATFGHLTGITNPHEYSWLLARPQPRSRLPPAAACRPEARRERERERERERGGSGSG